MPDTSAERVAVIGAGPAGLAAMKSLMEEGFDVTGFERRSAAGGLWTFDEAADCTSVTTTTRFQLSRFLAPMSDFPMPDRVSAYYQAYARRFGMHRRIRYGAVVSRVERGAEEDDGGKWLVHVEGEEAPREFERVVLAAGTENTPKMPVVEGLDGFEGRFIHSRAFKRPADFKGLNVVVMGQGNTAMDCAVDLVPYASKVYIAHRRGALILPRNVRGRRFDRFASWRIMQIMFWAAAHIPLVFGWAFYAHLLLTERLAWGADFHRPGSSRFVDDRDASFGRYFAAMVVNDGLVPHLRAGRIVSTRAVRRVVGPREVEMEDGEVVRGVDVIVACTGYRTSLEVLAPGTVEYLIPSPEDRAAARNHIPDVPLLYRNIFPPRWATSLACLNYTTVMSNAAVTREIVGMAVAQIWVGKSALPSRAEMEAQAAAQARWYVRSCREAPVTQNEGLVADSHEHMRWLNDMAGTGLNENLGWTLRGWRFFLTEPRLWFRVAWGVHSPHIYRLFETGKRKRWEGARAAIEHINEQSRADTRSKPVLS